MCLDLFGWLDCCLTCCLRFNCWWVGLVTVLSVVALIVHFIMDVFIGFSFVGTACSLMFDFGLFGWVVLFCIW